MEVINEPNPILEQENHFAGYQESIEALKNQPELVEFDKLCYELFEMNEMGKKFMEHVTDRFLLSTAGQPDHPSFANQAVWFEGVRYGFLLLRNSVKSHQQRIAAGTK